MCKCESYSVCVRREFLKAEAYFALHGLCSEVAGGTVSLQQQKLICHLPRMHLHKEYISYMQKHDQHTLMTNVPRAS